MRSGTGSKSGLLTLTVCGLCLHVVHYQNQRAALTTPAYVVSKMSHCSTSPTEQKVRPCLGWNKTFSEGEEENRAVGLD